MISECSQTYLKTGLDSAIVNSGLYNHGHLVQADELFLNGGGILRSPATASPYQVYLRHIRNVRQRLVELKLGVICSLVYNAGSPVKRSVAPVGSLDDHIAFSGSKGIDRRACSSKVPEPSRNNMLSKLELLMSKFQSRSMFKPQQEVVEVSLFFEKPSRSRAHAKNLALLTKALTILGVLAPSS